MYVFFFSQAHEPQLLSGDQTFPNVCAASFNPDLTLALYLYNKTKKHIYTNACNAFKKKLAKTTTNNDGDGIQLCGVIFSPSATD